MLIKLFIEKNRKEELVCYFSSLSYPCSNIWPQRLAARENEWHLLEWITNLNGLLVIFVCSSLRVSG